MVDARIGEWRFTVIFSLKNELRVSIDEHFHCLKVTHLYAFEKGIRTLQRIGLFVSFKGQKNVLSLYTINVKQCCPPHKSLFQQLKPIFD